MALDRLIEAIVEKQNPTVAGLDPKLDYIPAYIREASYEKYGGLSKLIRFLQAQSYRETARLDDELILFQKMPAG